MLLQQLQIMPDSAFPAPEDAGATETPGDVTPTP